MRNDTASAWSSRRCTTYSSRRRAASRPEVRVVSRDTVPGAQVPEVIWTCADCPTSTRSNWSTLTSICSSRSEGSAISMMVR